ncbi:MBL fold metallo-hydrolase [Desulfobacterales bacterium HSG2]|nr:MBL fold metallo-hydrolase [Desulfobacterales bacterium HSG2]
MKIKFIGVGSAFTTAEYYQSNMLITARNGKELLVDCGSDIRFSLNEGSHSGEAELEIDAIYISHLHSDHIGGMEWMAFRTYFSPNQQKPKLFMEENTMHVMWNCSLKGGLGRIEGKHMHLTDYFDCRPASDSGAFQWENIRFTLIKMPHILTGYKNFYSYGLLIKEVGDKGPTVFITTDTQFRRDLIGKIAKKASVIFHDCETSPFKSVVHAHYDDLCTLPAALRQKIWLYHYQPHPDRIPKADGFSGFVKKGQEFDFS